MTSPRPAALVCGLAVALLTVAIAQAQVPTTNTGDEPSQDPPQPRAVVVPCASKVGTRQECPANTSRGVVLTRSYGDSACLLGKTWGYDDKGVWVSDGCVADFLVARGGLELPAPEAKKGSPRYVPNAGFLTVDPHKGEMYVRLFSYARYLNQLDLDES